MNRLSCEAVRFSHLVSELPMRLTRWLLVAPLAGAVGVGLSADYLLSADDIAQLWKKSELFVQ